MKKRLMHFLILSLMNLSVIAQTINSEYHSLLAKKKNHIHEFLVGEKIDVKFNKEGKIKDYRGILKDFTEDGIHLSSFKKGDTTLQYISLNSISSVYKLLRKKRLVYGVMTAVSLAATIVLISALNSNNNNASDSFGLILVIYPITGTVVGGIAFLSTYVTEAIDTRSIKNGWHFYLQ